MGTALVVCGLVDGPNQRSLFLAGEQDPLEFQADASIGEIDPNHFRPIERECSYGGAHLEAERMRGQASPS